uniref:Uncharacterized protein n=1 Tax=Amphimedon queenslandica TaxID=400682 RepID=A0A1X7UTD1_AMPQE
MDPPINCWSRVHESRLRYSSPTELPGQDSSFFSTVMMMMMMMMMMKMKKGG